MYPFVKNIIFFGLYCAALSADQNEGIGKVHPSAKVHPSVMMEGEVEVGANTTIGAGCYLQGPLVIGENNKIGQNVLIGVDPEHKMKQGTGKVTIGNGNTIREFSVIQRGIGDLDTQIHNDCFIMAYAYIAHDCLIESDAILCARVSLAGHCHILRGAILGLSCCLHQFSTVGAHSLVGMGSVVVKDVPPFCVVMGIPACFVKFNAYSLEKLEIPCQDFVIESGSIQSTHSYVQECLRSFQAHARRKPIPLRQCR